MSLITDLRIDIFADDSCEDGPNCKGVDYPYCLWDFLTKMGKLKKRQVRLLSDECLYHKNTENIVMKILKNDKLKGMVVWGWTDKDMKKRSPNLDRYKSTKGVV